MLFAIILPQSCFGLLRTSAEGMLSRHLLRIAALRRCAPLSSGLPQAVGELDSYCEDIVRWLKSHSRPFGSTACVATTSRIPLVSRSQSTEAARFYGAESSSSSFPPPFLQKSRTTSSAVKPQAVPAAPPTDQEVDERPLTRQEKAELAAHPSDSFHSLKGFVEHDLYKALVEKPFKFEKMSTVQEAVLGLLPELASPTARGAEKQELPEGILTVKEDGTPRRGYREMSTDLLVKAKTGTGKTLAFLIPALEARVQDLIAEQRRIKTAQPESV